MAYAVLGKRDGMQCRVGYTVVQDIQTNTTAIRISSLEMIADRALGSYWVVGNVTVNGKKLWGYSTWYAQILLTTSWNRAGHCPEGAPAVTIEHDDAGNAEVRFRVSFSLGSTGTSLSYTSSVMVTLDTIPRVTELAAEAGALGETMILRLTRKNAEFRDTVSYQCGRFSGVIGEKTNQGQLVWVPPLELGAAYPRDTVVPVVLRVTTWLEDTQIGRRELTVSCTMPEWAVPSLTVELSDGTHLAEQYGGYVRTRSQLRVRTGASGIYGSTVTQIAVRCGGLTGSGEDVTFSLPYSGLTAVTVTVTDSRGRTQTEERTVDVLPYERPWARIIDVCRCDMAGNPAPEGAYARITFSAGITALNGNNGAAYRLERRNLESDVWLRTELTEFAGRASLTEVSVQFPAGIDTAYDCRILAADDFETVEGSAERLQAAFALLDFHRENRAIGIGQRANQAGMVCVGLDMKLYGHRITDLAEPEGENQAATKGYVDSKLRAMAQQLGLNWEEI